jgi:hypothetical protein
MPFLQKVYANFKVVPAKETDAAPPTPSMKKGIFYHGTGDSECIDKIWKEGLKPDLGIYQDRLKNLEPVKGHVYITKDLKTALTYAISPRNKGEYGYIFVIKGDELKDIHPDEDNIGEAIMEGKFPWLDSLAKKHLKGIPYEDDDNDYDDLLDGVIDGDSVCEAWALAGKIILPHLNDEQKLQIMSTYDNVAHEGVLFPSEVWKIRLDKVLVKDRGFFLDYYNISNFFKDASLLNKR